MNEYTNEQEEDADEKDLKIINMIIRNHHQELKRIKLQCSQEFEYSMEKSEYKIFLEVNKLVKVTNLPNQYHDFYLMLFDESSIPSSVELSEITKTREFDKLSEESIQGIFSRDFGYVAIGANTAVSGPVVNPGIGGITNTILWKLLHS